MKKNNKGFMLVEVIVTSTVIVTAMVGLYTSFNRLYGSYNTRNNYYNVDATYATKKVFNDMIKNDYINDFIANNFLTTDYEFIIKDNYVDNNFINDNQYDILFNKISELSTYYNIENLIIVKYDSNSIEKLKSDVTNKTFKEYIDYVIKYYDFSDTYSENNVDGYSYLLLTEIKENDKYFYANLRVR